MCHRYSTHDILLTGATIVQTRNVSGQVTSLRHASAGNTTRLANYNLASTSISAPTQLLSYSAQGQMSELRDSVGAVIANYVYRGDGKRAWKEGRTGTHNYLTVAAPLAR